MSNRFRWCLVVCVVISCAAATLLYSGAGPMAGSRLVGPDGAWHPVLAAFAEALTLPISTEGIADVRQVVLPVGLGLLLVLLSFDLWRRANGSAGEAASLPPGAPKPVRPGVGGGSRPSTSDEPDAAGEHRLSISSSGAAVIERAAPRPNLVFRWMLACGAAVILIGTLSALANNSWPLSWGWMFRTVAGLIWAAAIARCFDAVMARRVIGGLIGVGIVACVLSLMHRIDRKIDLFTWPIGPVTPTATFAAVFAALALGYGVAQMVRPGRRVVGVAQLGIGLAFLYVLVETERRGQLLAVFAAMVTLGAWALWHRARSRGMRIAVASIVLVSLAAGGAYVGREMFSGDRVAAGSISVRLEYWRLSLGMIVDRLSLGSGPDTFVTEMTDAIAPLRGLSPHLYHGQIDPEAHNEWIQAAVELGLPGALFWMAMPVGVLILACRPSGQADTAPRHNGRSGRPASSFGPESIRPTILSLSAALVVLVVAECTGIMLRGAMLPVWYWTLLGLLSATGRPGFEFAKVAHGESTPGRSGVLRFLAVVMLLVAMACAAASAVELGATDIRERLISTNTLINWRQDAEFASGRTEKGQDSGADAVALWQRLYLTIPGWADTCARYADALRRADSESAARLVLEQALRRDLNAHEPAANLLFAEQFTDDPRQKLIHAVRALRHAEVAGRVAALLDQIADDESVREAIDQQLAVDSGRVDADDVTPSDDDRGEWLRVHAYLEHRAGRLEEAIKAQQEAAELYLALEQRSDRYRRGHDAEADAFFVLASMLHEAGPHRLAEAYAAIIEAERLAVLGISHQRLADPDPSLGFVGGEVIPTDFPERLYPLWRLSALLRVETGNESMLTERILSYTPMSDWMTPGVVANEWRELCRIAVRELGRLPPEKRPSHYGRLVQEIGEENQRKDGN